jgi:hypothetical protein
VADHPWLPGDAGLFKTEDVVESRLQVQKVFAAVDRMQAGKLSSMSAEEFPTGVGGHVTRMNLKTLIVMTGLHQPGPSEKDRPDYDLLEVTAVQEAKNAGINPDKKMVNKFLQNCAVHDTTERVTGSWPRAFKACADKLCGDMKEKERRLRGFSSTHDTDYEDMMDREIEGENTLCAVHRESWRSDVFFRQEDLFNITGCLTKVKMWDTDEWLKLREYKDKLKLEYRTHREQLPFIRANLDIE